MDCLNVDFCGKGRPSPCGRRKVPTRVVVLYAAGLKDVLALVMLGDGKQLRVPMIARDGMLEDEDVQLLPLPILCVCCRLKRLALFIAADNYFAGTQEGKPQQCCPIATPRTLDVLSIVRDREIKESDLQRVYAGKVQRPASYCCSIFFAVAFGRGQFLHIINAIAYANTKTYYSKWESDP